MGQVIYFEPVTSGSGLFKKEIDISAQPKGTYFVEIVSENERIVKKVVLQ